MRMNSAFAFCLAAALALAASPAQAHGQARKTSHAAHVHGQARLMLAVAGNAVQIGLETPLDNLLGFEHAPRTAKEKQAVDALRARLDAPQTLFELDPAARCQVESVRIAGLPHARTAHDHADLEADFSFTCAQPPRALTLQLFSAFPRLQRLDVEQVTPAGQALHRLGPGQSRLEW